MRVGHALVRSCDGQNRDGDGRGPRDRVYADAAHEGVHDRAVRHGLVKEGAASALAALPDRGDEILSVAERRVNKAGEVLQQVLLEKAPDKVLIGAVAADIPGRPVQNLQNGDREGAKIVLERVGVLVGHDAEIKEVHAPDALIVFGLLRVFSLCQGFVPVHPPDLFKGQRFAVEKALEL